MPSSAPPPPKGCCKFLAKYSLCKGITKEQQDMTIMNLETLTYTGAELFWLDTDWTEHRFPWNKAFDDDLAWAWPKAPPSSEASWFDITTFEFLIKVLWRFGIVVAFATVANCCCCCGCCIGLTFWLPELTFCKAQSAVGCGISVALQFLSTYF